MSAIFGEAIPYVEGGGLCGGCTWAPFWGLNGSLAVTGCDDLTMTISAGNGDIGAMQLNSAGDQIETGVTFLALYRVTLTGYAGKGTGASWATRPDATFFNEVLLIPDTATVEFYDSGVSATSAAFDPTVANYIRVELQQSLWSAKIWRVTDAEPGAWTFSGTPAGAGTRIAWNRFEFVDNSVTSGPLVASVQVLSSSVTGCGCTEEFARNDASGWGTSQILSLPWEHNTTTAEFSGGFDHITNPAAFLTTDVNSGFGQLDLGTDTITSNDPWAWITPDVMTSPVELLYRFKVDPFPWPSDDYLDLRIGAQEGFTNIWSWQGPVLQFAFSPGWDYIKVYPLRVEGSLVTYSEYTISAYEPGTFINARMLLNDTGVQGWVWLDGETEPTLPNVEYTGSSVSYNPTLLGVNGVSQAGSGIFVYFDSICALQGLACSNGSCGGSIDINYAHVFPPESTAGGITS